MQPAYTPRDCIPLQANLPIERPEQPPELVHFHDSAMQVFTDFTRVYPVTITSERTIDYALHKMKNSGVRLLLVVNKKHHMIGLISAYQIMGDDPVRLAQDKQLDHGQITVAMLMQPQRDIRVVELSHLRDARVGHIVATLHQLEQKHMIVVDQGNVSGLFSANQISRQLGRKILQEEMPSHSLAEMVHTIG